MAIFPVIMCGGSGVRLWPASRPDRPKPFAPLLGGRSSFQDAALRVAGLGPVLIVGAAPHRSLIQAELAEVGVEASLLLEPGGRDSAAAMAAAALWVQARDPDGVIAVVSADHYLPDAQAFRGALVAAAQAAEVGRIVTLGVTPREASTAYGYIRAAKGEGVRAVQAFVEKPDAATAARYVSEGYLWNSGVFVAPVSTLIYELEKHAPEIPAAVRAGLESVREVEGAGVLGDAFLTAPRISIDYALMEKTNRALVLPVSFGWADLGAWDGVLALSDKDDEGNHVEGAAVVRNTTGSYVRAGGGAEIIALGLKDVAVVAEGRRVLVADLSFSQAVKGGFDALRELGPTGFDSLGDAASWYERWLRTAALPLWWAAGGDHGRGGYVEALSLDGLPRPAQRRGRVQGRMIFVFAKAQAMGWPGPWRQAARHGLAYMVERFTRPDGLVRAGVSVDGAPVDDTAAVYDQAFALLGLATLHQADPEAGDLRGLAARIRGALETLRHPQGGFREAGPHPFQANCHMHLLEAALAWEEAGDPSWAALSDEIANLALNAFIDHRGVLSEFFNADWTRAEGDDGRLVEPGHQFEWAWLLNRWAQRRSRADAEIAARALYEAGRRGIDPVRGCAVNELWDDLSVRDPGARLWPQTEHMRAALVLGEPDEALAAANCLKTYLETPCNGVWRDKLRPDGTFADEPAPATSLYHILGACLALFDVSGSARQ